MQDRRPPKKGRGRKRPPRKIDIELARNARKMEAEAIAAWRDWMFGKK